MSELRKQLIEIVDSGEAYPEETVDRVIDAVIVALPSGKYIGETPDFLMGVAAMRHDIKAILQAAKESE